MLKYQFQAAVIWDSFKVSYKNLQFSEKNIMSLLICMDSSTQYIKWKYHTSGVKMEAENKTFFNCNHQEK